MLLNQTPELMTQNDYDFQLLSLKACIFFFLHILLLLNLNNGSQNNKISRGKAKIPDTALGKGTSRHTESPA